MRNRIPSETKRRRCVTLGGRDLDLIEQTIPNLSAYLRAKLRQDYPTHYWNNHPHSGAGLNDRRTKLERAKSYIVS